MRRRRLSLAVLFLSLAVPTLAAADNPVVDREADERFKRGLELVKQGKAEEARLMFQEVYAISPTMKVLWNLALAELDSSHPVDALRHFHAYADDPRGEPKKKELLPSLVDKAYKQTGHVRVDAPTGAAVSVDGQALSSETKLTEPVDLMPGRHTVEASIKGKTYKVDVEAPAGQVVPAHIEVPPEPTGAQLLDRTAKPPPVATAPAPTATASSHAEGSSTARTVTIVSLGVGAGVAWGLGAYFGLTANSNDSTAQTLRQGMPPGLCANPAAAGCSDLRDANSSQRSNATAATVMFVVGGVLTAATVGTILLWRTGKGHERAALVPAVAPGAAGLQLTGRF